MKYIEIKANAKINLSLDVLRKREDGYHDLRMIMQSIELHDIVRVESSVSGISVESNSPWIPSGTDNIAGKAAKTILDEFGIKDGLKITIKKNIPIAAGLAGGSADAAAVLKAVNEIFSLGLGQKELIEIGCRIGADVPFCLVGGTMLAEGIGEKLTELEPFRDVDIVLVKPVIGVSTGWVFQNLDLAKVNERPDTALLVSAIADRRLELLASGMRNVLETVTLPRYGIVGAAKEMLVSNGALGSMMSGSGPTVFGIYSNSNDAQKAVDILKATGMRWDCFITKTT